jgi:hypothetical protein
MAETLTLDEDELSALFDLADGRISDAAGAEAAFASLIRRGLASVDGDEVVFVATVASAFEPLAGCKVNVLLLNDAGDAVAQYYLGEKGAGTRVSMVGAGLAVERIEEAALPGAIAGALVAHLASAGATPPPNAASFEALASALDMEGLQPLAWGGLTIARGATGAPLPDAPAPDWVLVIHTEPGYVWEHAERKTIAFAHNEEELAELVAEALLE